MSTVTAVSIVLNIGYAAMWIIGAVVSATVVVAARVGGLALTALAFTINFVVSELIPRLPGVVLATLSLAATTASWAGAVTLLLIRGLAVIAAHALALLKVCTRSNVPTPSLKWLAFHRLPKFQLQRHHRWGLIDLLASKVMSASSS